MKVKLTLRRAQLQVTPKQAQPFLYAMLTYPLTQRVA